MIDDSIPSPRDFAPSLPLTRSIADNALCDALIGGDMETIRAGLASKLDVFGWREKDIRRAVMVNRARWVGAEIVAQEHRRSLGVANVESVGLKESDHLVYWFRIRVSLKRRRRRKQRKPKRVKESLLRCQCRRSRRDWKGRSEWASMRTGIIRHIGLMRFINRTMDRGCAVALFPLIRHSSLLIVVTRSRMVFHAPSSE